jgi:hypothetical protein
MIMDPWLEGTAFDNGWGLLSKTTLDYEDFRGITHIWFSHEHPDHFSPPSLRHIPEDCRGDITILFQETTDKKVVEYCKKQGYGKVIELPPGEALDLGDGVSITCWPYQGFEDSYSLIVTPDSRILNLNDCTVNTEPEIRAVKDQVGRVDLLFTQFSISAWDGNVEEVEHRHAGAQGMLDRTILQSQILQPRWVVPFASFIWFCHEENEYMNSAFLPIAEVFKQIDAGFGGDCVMMYPGDQWKIGGSHESDRALERYAGDQASLPERDRYRAEPVSPEDLCKTAAAFCQKLLEGSSRSKVRLHLLRQNRRLAKHRGQNHRRGNRRKTMTMRLDPARIWVPDHNQAYLFDPLSGLRPKAMPKGSCDVAIASAALNYAFKFLWGGNTLHINGRFRRIAPHGRGPLFHYFALAGNRNAGMTIRWRHLAKKLRA